MKNTIAPSQQTRLSKYTNSTATIEGSPPGVVAKSSRRSIEVRLADAGQGPAVGEARIDGVPGDNLAFTGLPAEKNHVVLNLVRKIDQSLIDILQEASESFDLP